jgi:hypothetical protein
MRGARVKARHASMIGLLQDLYGGGGDPEAGEYIADVR